MAATLKNGLSYTVEILFSGDSTYSDVTTLVRQVEISRGRSNEVDVFQAGSANITLLNNDRQFDPLNTSGTYYGKIVPRIPVRVKCGSTTIFTGYIYDMDYDYSIPSGGKDVSAVNMSCIDAFSVLGEQYLSAFTPSSQLSGARVTAVLDRSEVSFPSGSRDIRTGSSTLGTQLVAAQTNVLDYLQDIAASEQGFLFVAGDGKLTFLGRNDVVSTSVAMTFADDGTNTKYQDFSVAYGSELLYNRVITTRSAGSTYTATDSASITKYLTKTLTLDGLLVSTDAQAQDIGTNLLAKYKEPELRFSEVSTVIESTATAFTNVVALEIGNLVSVKKTYKTGAPSSVTRSCIVQGLSHRITPASHVVTVQLGSADSRAFLRLDNTTFGRLNQNLLGW